MGRHVEVSGTLFDLRRTAQLAGLAGGLAWVVTLFLDDGGSLERALLWAGTILLTVALFGLGLLLVRSDVLALRVFVALALPTLVWGVFGIVHGSANDPDAGRRRLRRGRRARLRRAPGLPCPRSPAGHPLIYFDAAGIGALVPGLHPVGASGAPRKGYAVGVIEADAVRRVAMISVHTSPLDQPGTGDAGGMNVYVIELSRRLAAAGIEVDIFTRSTSSRLDPIVDLGNGITVRNIHAGPFEGLSKGELPGQLCVFAREVLRTEAGLPLGHYDMVHSHYWLSGQVGALARDRWGVPLVHTMHTMAKVKNDAMALGDTPEPAARIIGEEQVVEAADMLIASTDLEAKQLIDLYGADPGRVEVVYPGVDLSVFRPRDTHAAREQLGLPLDAHVVLFAGRLQPLKAPDVLLRAVACLLDHAPDLRSRLVVPIVGGPSGSGLDHPESLADLAAELRIDDVVRFVPPVPPAELAVWDAAASVVAVPSYNESFGLVAAEAQAAGTPVIAAAVGGLSTVVADGVSGLLLDTHEPADWAHAIGRVLVDDGLRARLAAGARTRAGLFSWEETAERTLDIYERARASLRAPV